MTEPHGCYGGASRWRAAAARGRVGGVLAPLGEDQLRASKLLSAARSQGMLAQTGVLLVLCGVKRLCVGVHSAWRGAGCNCLVPHWADGVHWKLGAVWAVDWIAAGHVLHLSS